MSRYQIGRVGAYNLGAMPLPAVSVNTQAGNGRFRRRPSRGGRHPNIQKMYDRYPMLR